MSDEYYISIFGTPTQEAEALIDFYGDWMYGPDDPPEDLEYGLEWAICVIQRLLEETDKCED